MDETQQPGLPVNNEESYDPNTPNPPADAETHNVTPDPANPIHQLSFPERVKLFEEKLQALCNEHGLSMGVQHDFPRYKILPDDLLLALKVVANHGMQMFTQYTDKLKPKENLPDANTK